MVVSDREIETTGEVWLLSFNGQAILEITAFRLPWLFLLLFLSFSVSLSLYFLMGFIEWKTSFYNFQGFFICCQFHGISVEERLNGSTIEWDVS